MKIGIFSDVHSNLEALEAVLNALEAEHVDRLICLGDVVGYGPDPNPCVDEVASSAGIVVAGNHDAAAVGAITTDDFNEYARLAVEWTQSVLSPDSERFLSRLPMMSVEEGAMWVHATPDRPEEWDYIFNAFDARRHFSAMKTDLCFVGHSHVPGAFVQDKEGSITVQHPNKLSIDENRKYIINVGSVGQPRDGDPRACYGVLDLDMNRFKLGKIAYPVETVQDKMRSKHLPAYLIERLAFGH